MAVPFGEFSIREYVSNMRAVDVTKCWPFGAGESMDVKKDVVEALLPPITVTKFRWWAHELELLRSRDNEEEKQIPSSSPTVADNNNLDDDASGEDQMKKKKRGRKKKKKKKKKRSIVEIFASTVVFDDGVVSVKKAIKSRGKFLGRKRGFKRRKFDQKMISSELGKKLQKNGKKFKKAKGKGSIADKDVGLDNRNVNGPPCLKRIKGKMSDSVSGNIKKLSTKSLSSQKRQKVVQKGRLAVKRQFPVAPIRSILKKNTMENPELNSSVYKLQSNDQINNSGSEKSARHVTFFDKDDNTSPKESPFSNVCKQTENNLFPGTFSASEGFKDPPSLITEKVCPTEVSGSDDASCISMVNRTDHLQAPTGNKQLLPDVHCHVSTSSSLMGPQVTCQESVKHMAENCQSEHEATIPPADDLILCSQSSLPGSHSSPHAGIPALLTAPEERHIFSVNPQIVSDISRAGKYIDHVGDPVCAGARMNSVSSAATPISLSATSADSISNADRRYPSFSLSDASFGGLDGRFKPVLAPSDLLCSRWALPDVVQRANASRNKCLNEEFCGLPLNSHGELIKLAPSINNRSNYPRESTVPTSCFRASPSQNLLLTRSSTSSLNATERETVGRERPTGHLNLFPLQSSMKERQSEHTPVRSCAIEAACTIPSHFRLHGVEKGSHQPLSQLNSRMSSMNITSDGCIYYGQLQKQNEIEKNPKTRQTMRLMGKDVTVGSSKDMQGSEAWKKNEDVIEHHPSCITQHCSSERRDFLQDWVPIPTSERPRQTFLTPSTLEFQINQATQSSLMKAPQSRISPQCLNNHATTPSQNASSIFRKNQRYNMGHHSQSLSPPAMVNLKSGFLEPSPSAAEILRFDSSRSSERSICYDRCQDHGHCGSADFCHRLNLPARGSAFDFPFLLQDCSGEHIQQLPSLHGPRNQNHPPWQLHDGLHQRPFSATPSGPMPYHLHMKSSPGPMPLFPSQPVPVTSGVKTASAFNRSHQQRVNVQERLKSDRLLYFEDSSSRFNGSKKRTAAEPVDSKLPQKIPKLKDFIVTKELTREKFNGEVHCELGTARIQKNGDKLSNEGGWFPVVARKDEMRAPLVEGTARSGPIKLSAGAKHVLKSCEKMDQCHSKPTHSTFPFASSRI